MKYLHTAVCKTVKRHKGTTQCVTRAPQAEGSDKTAAGLSGCVAYSTTQHRAEKYNR